VVKNSNKISSSEITAPALYFNRRKFIQAGILAASTVATGMAYRHFNHPARAAIKTAPIEGLTASAANDANGFHAADQETSLQDITHYNNFYEFSTDKEGVADEAANFDTKGWQVSVEGLVKNPRVFDLGDLLKISPPEERIYRMRCVEAWSMVIPWAGFLMWSSRPAMRSLSPSRPCWIQSGCPDNRPMSSTGLTSKACGWMKRCTR
jgi:sulfoxide reductase catalytic subunit YedY